MKKSVVIDESCQTSLKLLGDFWTLRIIDALADGELRYCELQRKIDNLNPVTLSNRLKKLENVRLIRRNEDLPIKIAVTYRLTKQGRAALPVVTAINQFSKKLAIN